MTQTLTPEVFAQIKADIAARKAMPEFGESIEGNIKRLHVIGATRDHFSTEAVEMLVNALDELLANREAQPVMYASEETLAYAREGEKSLVTWSEPMGSAVVPLFTAPPAPSDAQPVASREHFESLCNQFWNWAEFDEINAGEEEPRLQWDGQNYTHRVTAALWRMYQAAPPAPAASANVQPVGYYSLESIASLKERGYASISAEHLVDSCHPLYSTPPAPAVPTIATMENVNTLSSHFSSYIMTEDERDLAVEVWNACRAAMLAQPVSSGYTLPENVREALTLALQAMEFMGDTLNNIDAVCTEDVEYVTPAFTAVRKLLAAAPEGGNG